ALGNDVQKNLAKPLAELRELDPSLPEIRVLVRTGDTPASERTKMTRRPPHVLVTTPESLFILLTSDGGRRILSTVRTAIVDEIHAVARDKRGSHLALSLERLVALAGEVQRIGCSATQRPIEEIARFLAGEGRECAIVDAGHRREMDLAIEVPPSPLAAVCSHEQWDEVYGRIADLAREHRSTLVFVNTRKLAERVAARLADRLGEGQVLCHHGSLARERRLQAEELLKAGKLRALVATASLELGIDIGDVDLAIQLGSVRSIHTFLQRMGRAGHGVGRIPKGRVFPLTLDELAEAAAALRAARRGELDRIEIPARPLDILAQQIVAECVPATWSEDELFARFRRAYPYRDLDRADFDACVALHAEGRSALLHRDGVNGRVRATRRARLRAITSGGAIADAGDYLVLLEPEETVVGSVHEDFAIESNGGDVFQLGTASWRVLRIEPGIVRVADAKGAPPTIPFWVGEAPSRTPELAAVVGEVREVVPSHGGRDDGLPPSAAEQLAEYVAEGSRALGAAPTPRRVIAERFFDEAGGTQLVLHSLFGGRINRAWGLALRKRLCRSFGFELQAAANDDAIVFSLGPQHGFPTAEVFDFLHPDKARELLVQAVLAHPIFKTRWRWNAARALLFDRMRRGKRMPVALQRMISEDLLAAAFPQSLACGETLPPGDIEIPWDHPIVRQTVADCLHEALDVDGLVHVLRGLKSGEIERVAVDSPEPSAFARGILAAQPYAFLDDAPLEERRTQAVMTRRTLSPRDADQIGALDPEAVRLVREQAWPRPRDREEVHETLLWMGHVTTAEGREWQPWLEELRSAGRVAIEDGRYYAVEASRDRKEQLKGRLLALGPVFVDEADPQWFAPELLAEVEHEGFAIRVRLDGRTAVCERGLLARIHRYTVDRLRREIEPVTAGDFLRFLAQWQNVADDARLEGPRGVADVARRLAGYEAPAAHWERSILWARVHAYRREWLDQLTVGGELAWGRLYGAGASAPRATPICLLPREELDVWLGLAQPPSVDALSASARAVHETLLARGALFPKELASAARLLPTHFESAVAELIGFGLVTADSFAALRFFFVPASRRTRELASVGRFSAFRRGATAPPSIGSERAVAQDEFVARAMLRRTGVVFRKTIARERHGVPWIRLLRALRTLEARGDVRGGRFVSGFDGEQYALPDAVVALRAIRRRGRSGEGEAPSIPFASLAPSDPLSVRGILTPDALPRAGSATDSNASGRADEPPREPAARA
ncbi:MAG TPA: helicase-related protein, partial [Planctomycetota bacterium]|nr:helicase-related protein [Planctomycetota bacterium]